MIQDPALFSFVDVSERDLDFVLAEEIECSRSFRAWFLQKTSEPDQIHELLRLGRSISTRHGETDLLVVSRNGNGLSRALLIENKIAASFTPLQPERYGIRGKEGIDSGEWNAFATVLIAPERYLTGVAENKFTQRVSYEDCEKALDGIDSRTEFKRRIFRAACSKAQQPWTQRIDPAVTAWFVAARSFGVEQFPDLPLPAEGQGRAPSSKWITFVLKCFLQSRVIIEIKPHVGVVDLRLSGVRIGDLRRELGALIPDGAETHEAKSGKSVSIQTKHTPMDLEGLFWGQEMNLQPMLASADRFLKFAQDQRERITRLLGYDPPNGD